MFSLTSSEQGRSCGRVDVEQHAEHYSDRSPFAKPHESSWYQTKHTRLITPGVFRQALLVSVAVVAVVSFLGRLFRHRLFSGAGYKPCHRLLR